MMRSWNWVRWVHLVVCLVLVGFVVLTFTANNRLADMKGTSIVLAVIFIGQHLLITFSKRWHRFDHV